MIVFLNGQFVPEHEARISVFDRSFQFGDGLFESIRIANGEPFRWGQHWERLADGALGLRIGVPFDSDHLCKSATELIRLNDTPEAVLRITLSRGAGQRGYSPAGADQPVIVMSVYPAETLAPSPPQWRLFTSSLRLDDADPLAQWKTSNKLRQVMARVEAEDHGANEALLLNTRGEVCETSSGNVFWFEGTTLHTPPVAAGLLPGITRAVVTELAPRIGLSVVQSRAHLSRLAQANGVFVTLTSRGLIEVLSVDGQEIQRASDTQSLYQAYCRLVAEETHARP